MVVNEAAGLIDELARLIENAIAPADHDEDNATAPALEAARVGGERQSARAAA